MLNIYLSEIISLELDIIKKRLEGEHNSFERYNDDG